MRAAGNEQKWHLVFGMVYNAQTFETWGQDYRHVLKAWALYNTYVYQVKHKLTRYAAARRSGKLGICVLV